MFIWLSSCLWRIRLHFYSEFPRGSGSLSAPASITHFGGPEFDWTLGVEFRAVARVVAVHGILNTFVTRPQMVEAWAPALLGGVELAAGGPRRLTADDVGLWLMAMCFDWWSWPGTGRCRRSSRPG